MSYLKVLEGMIEWGQPAADGTVPAASCVKITGNRTFAVQDDGEAASDGFSIAAREDKSLMTVAFGPGTLETDNFTGDPQPGNSLSWDTSAGKFKVLAGSEVAVLKVLSRDGDVLTCKSLIL